MSTITTIIFDCFGVLYQDAFKQFLDDHGKHMPQPREHYYDLARQNERGYIEDVEFYRELSEATGIEPDEIKRGFRSTDSLNLNVVQIIQELRTSGKYKIGMLTNIEREFLQRFLDNHEIGHLFDVLLASSETVYIKPQREIFEALEARTGTPFGEWYFIDDTRDNVEAASSYGIKSHLFTTTDELRSELSKLGLL
jgi:HAD superfamily hydrolase (TIGR01509 family)